eukprot:1179576-Prorocentrum_minimum.AAC.8
MRCFLEFLPRSRRGRAHCSLPWGSEPDDPNRITRISRTGLPGLPEPNYPDYPNRITRITRTGYPNGLPRLPEPGYPNRITRITRTRFPGLLEPDYPNRITRTGPAPDPLRAETETPHEGGVSPLVCTSRGSASNHPVRRRARHGF